MNFLMILGILLSLLGIAVGAIGLKVSTKYIDSKLDKSIKIFSQKAEENVKKYFYNDVNPFKNLSINFNNKKK